MIMIADKEGGRKAVHINDIYIHWSTLSLTKQTVRTIDVLGQRRCKVTGILSSRHYISRSGERLAGKLRITVYDQVFGPTRPWMESTTYFTITPFRRNRL